MADNQYQYGFRWHSFLHGGTGRPAPVKKRLASGLAITANPGAVSVDLNVGDPVKLVNDGTITLAAAGDSIYGIVDGIGPTDFVGSAVGSAWNTKVPTGTTGTVGGEREIYVHVLPAAGSIFRVVCDDNVTATTLAAYIAFIEENCDHVFIPDATNKKAKPALDISTHAAATSGWRIHDMTRQINQDPSGAFFEVLVTCNEVQQAPFVTAGV